MEKSESPWPVGNTFTGVVAGSCGRSGEGPDETVTTVADFDGLQMRLVGLVGSEVGFETFISAVRFVATPDGPATDFKIFGRPRPRFLGGNWTGATTCGFERQRLIPYTTPTCCIFLLSAII